MNEQLKAVNSITKSNLRSFRARLNPICSFIAGLLCELFTSTTAAIFSPRAKSICGRVYQNISAGHGRAFQMKSKIDLNSRQQSLETGLMAIFIFRQQWSHLNRIRKFSTSTPSRRFQSTRL